MSRVNGAVVIQLRPPEIHTLLAALRYYQQHGQGESEKRSPAIDAIATNGGEVPALDPDDIERLCERINLAPAPR